MAINAVSLLFRQVGIQFIRSKIDSASILKARSGDLAMRLVSVKSRALALLLREILTKRVFPV